MGQLNHMNKQIINKIGILCIKNKELLVVYKPKIKQYITLGGSLEEGETNFECMTREAMEEISCTVKNFTYFNTFKRNNITIHCYFANLKGKINPQNEIKKVKWINRHSINSKLPLAHLLKNQIIPELIRRKIL